MVWKVKIQSDIADAMIEGTLDENGEYIGEEEAPRICEHCNEEIVLKCADPDGNLDTGFCKKK